jgi:predicted transcriptional regulator
MSRFNYTPLQQSATRLITKFGAAYAFERLADRGYDAESGKPITRRTVYTGEAAISEFTKSEVAQNTVEQGDIKLLAEVQDYKIGDLVSVDYFQYRIISIVPIRKSQRVIAVYLHLRK